METPDAPLDSEHTAPVSGPAESAGAHGSAHGDGGDGPVSKKDQIVALYRSGFGEIEDIALLTRSRPGYVGEVLHDAGLAPGYFDLYTSTQHPMNVYSKYFAGKLGFKDAAAAEESVRVIDRLYHQFEIARDRAGQHHALQMALTMYDRARWTDKPDAAEPFRRWLLGILGVSPDAA
jgi:hypothetical protein